MNNTHAKHHGWTIDDMVAEHSLQKQPAVEAVAMQACNTLGDDRRTPRRSPWNHSRLFSQRGSAYIAAAIGASILSIVAAGILTYLSNEYTFNYRSRGWNQALHLSEAGLEIGFAEINFQYYEGGSSAGFQSSRGWSAVTNGIYAKTVSNLTDTAGHIIGSISLTVDGVGGINPWVTSVATVPTTPRVPQISRAVRATLYAPSMYPVGLMAKNNLDMNGNNLNTDSYNSITNGFYLGSASYSSDPTYIYAGGDIAANGSVLNSISVGNADIYGDVYTGPGGTFTLGPNGSIGDTFDTAERADTVAEGETAGFVAHDFNVDFADVKLPAGATSWTSGGISGNAISKDTTLASGDYKVTSINLGGSDRKDTLTIAGNVRIYVTGNVSLTGNSAALDSGIVIAPGASLKVYVAGSVGIAGNGVVNNAGYPINNSWFGLPSSTSWTVSGNGYWNGTIYAPEATVSFKGGGTSGNASGAVVANNITLTGEVTFHYDEALGASSTGAGYAFRTWQELRLVNGVWVR